MKIIDKIFLHLFTKSAEKIVSKEGCFTLQIPNGFRHKSSAKCYQIFCPSDLSFLFQMSGYILVANEQNQFNVDKELSDTLKTNPNAVIQSIGKYNCVFFASMSNDEKQKTYTWRIGDKNKRILITFLLRDVDNAEVSDKLAIAYNHFKWLGNYARHIT